MMIYRNHNCTRSHRTYKAWAKCSWPRACTTGAGVTGEGEYVFVAYCGGRVEVRLYADPTRAVAYYKAVSTGACGQRCEPKKHRVGRIERINP